MFRRSFRTLIAAAILTSIGPSFAQSQSAPQARFVSSFAWSDPDPAFGGFSGIELGEDGLSFTAVSDRGTIATGNFTRKDSKIIGMTDFEISKLHGLNGPEMPRYFDDSEGLALASDGTIYISFESEHRVWSYATPHSDAVALPRHPDFKDMQNNSSLEALAIDRNGTLYTMPERSGEITRPFPVYRFKNGRWDQPFAVPRSGDYLLVGADIGPDGRLYILERSLILLGFTSRVRSFEMGKKSLTDERLLIQSPLGLHDNLEGISVWRDGEGNIRLTMVSDNNFRAFQRNEIVEYALTEPLVEATE
ncbi:MAG: esterase-like activity of phytase family protein [Paracoccaceae bacterium]